jgi:hypothetical protein
MPNEQLLEFLYRYSEKIIELAHSMHGSCVRKMNKKKTNYRLVLSSYFARAFEISESILLLVRDNRITDAGVLLRSLTNLIINLRYIEKNKEERATLLLFDLATQHRKLYEKSKDFFDSVGKTQQVNRYIQFYRNEEQRLQRIIRRNYPNATPWDKIRISDKAAAQHDMQYVYDLLYTDLSRYEHHDFSAMRSYVNPDTADPIITIGSRRHSPVLNPPNILMITNIIFGIVIELFNDEFRLRWRERITRLTQEFMRNTGVTA